MRGLGVHLGSGMAGELLPKFLRDASSLSFHSLRHGFVSAMANAHSIMRLNCIESPLLPAPLLPVNVQRRLFTSSTRGEREKRVKGIEPSCAAWEAAVLPLNYTREEIFDFRFAIADCNRNNFRSEEHTSE